jgi:3,4-dihydroxy-2-butanone 4-phosphate synthase
VLSELVLDDGRMQRLPDLQQFAAQHHLPLVSIADLIEHLQTVRSADSLVGASTTTV